MSVTSENVHPSRDINYNATSSVDFDDILQLESYDEPRMNTYSNEFRQTHGYSESRDHSPLRDYGGQHDFRKPSNNDASRDRKRAHTYNQFNGHERPDEYAESRGHSESRGHLDSFGYAQSDGYDVTNGNEDSRGSPGSYYKRESYGYNELTTYNQSGCQSCSQNYEDVQNYEESPQDWESSGLYMGSASSSSSSYPWGSSEFSNYPNINHDEEDMAEMFDEDLNDVPSYDELPSVLFLTGDIDERTLKKSMHLYVQKKRLKRIQEMNERKDTAHAPQKVPRSYQRPSVQYKNKNLNIRLKQSDDYDTNKSEYDKRKMENQNISNCEKVPSRVYDRYLGMLRDNFEAVKTVGNMVSECNDDRKEDADAQIALIREKRLEKLGRLTSEYNYFKNEERNLSNPAFHERDNRTTIMNEEIMNKRKLKTHIIVNKDKQLLQTDINSGTPENKPDRREGNYFKSKGKTCDYVQKENEIHIEHSATSDKNTITNKELPKTDKSINDKTAFVEKCSKEKERNDAKSEDSKDNSDSESDIPYVMKLIKAKKKSPKDGTKRKESKLQNKSESDSECNDFYDDFPFVGKQEQKAVYGKSSRRKIVNKNTETEHDDEEIPAKYITYMFFSPVSQKVKDKTVKSKPPTKNKNQTIKTITETPTSIEAAGTREIKDASTASQVKQTVQRHGVLKLQMSDVGERRAQAFKRIKEKHYQSGIHCSSCGRSDCNSTHVQKMKEMIRAARQTGFEVVDVTPDGNCMFAAVVNQLEFYMDYKYNSRSLREAAVNWMIENPNSEDGTPYCSFMEEDWETYLQRMLGEGQWGDHVILRAIVQVIGHSVKVFNVGDGEGHWTMIESRDARADEDGQPIILGQLGEFHYVSLRPTVIEINGIDPDRKAETSESIKDGIKDDFDNIRLEGNESIAMFEEGHIDEESGIPVLHFSYLLKKIIRQAIVDFGAQSFSTWEDWARKQETSCTAMFVTGEVGNRVYFNLPYETDSKTNGLVLYSNKNTRVSSIEDSNFSGSYILYESGVHQGYAKITNRGILYGLQFLSNKIYSENSKHQEEDEKYVREGGRRLTTMYLWRIPAMQCKVWPSCAISWKTRKRFENWPPKYLIDSIVDTGCLLKPTPHKFSQDAENEWEIGFELAEKTLFRDAVTSSQRYCYMAWKVLIVQTIDFSGPFTFNHTRSVFLYSCEKIPLDFWASNPGACIIYMFDEVLRCLKKKQLPNYFVPTNNMLDYFTGGELKDTEEKILTVRNQPITFIQQFQDHFNMTLGGSKIIQTIQNDVYDFCNHRNVRRTTLEVFVPASTDLARECLKAGEYESGFNMLSETFEERLSASTCDDTLPYHLFLQNAVTGLDQNTLVWFSAYAEMQLKGQMPNPLIMDLHGDQELMKIKEVVPVEIAGEFADTLIPKTFTYNTLEFYNDFAVFLRRIGKAGAVRVLNYAHDSYKKMLTDITKTHKEDRTWEISMMQIYFGLLFMYREQGQDEKLKEVYPHMDELATRLNSRMAYAWLITIYTYLREDEKAKRVAEICKSLQTGPNDSLAEYYFSKFIQSWPMKVAMAY